MPEFEPSRFKKGIIWTKTFGQPLIRKKSKDENETT